MSDLIDRKTVFDVIDKCILEKLEGDTVEIKESLKLITKIYRIPSAQPQRKTGKWIYHSNWETDGECGYECSECGMGSDVDYNYCPRCGAKMEVRTNE